MTRECVSLLFAGMPGVRHSSAINSIIDTSSDIFSNSVTTCGDSNHGGLMPWHGQSGAGNPPVGRRETAISIALVWHSPVSKIFTHV
jgi:hypothetical protein